MYLLDVNLLIALAWDAHVFHQRAHLWFGQMGSASFATCNTTQSGFVRVSLNPKAMKCTLGIDQVSVKLESFSGHPGHKFWEDGDLQIKSQVWRTVTGHNPVTDTNLILIAHRHAGKLATLDDGIKNRLPQEQQIWVEVIK